MANKLGKSAMRPGSVLGLALLVALAGGMQSAAGADAPVEQRLREELRALMTELVQSGAFGDRPAQEISLTVDAPAQRVSDLGLLVDSKHDSRDGLHVLAVTPGGSGERMGLRGGDVLVALNGRSLAGTDAAATLRGMIDAMPNGSALAFEIRRDGAARTLNGTLSAVELPPMRLTIGPAPRAAAADPAAGGCGRISEFDVAPRQQGLHAAKIIAIDGEPPGPTGSTSFQVPAGRHVLKVAEQIEPRYLAFNDRLRNAGPGSRYKQLEVDVAADTTLLVAARLNDEKRNEWRDGAYWDPVVWKTSAERCR